MPSSPRKPRVVVIVGPTGVGNSACPRLASRRGAEIVRRRFHAGYRTWTSAKPSPRAVRAPFPITSSNWSITTSRSMPPFTGTGR
jgi:hypothetical protein